MSLPTDAPTQPTYIKDPAGEEKVGGGGIFLSFRCFGSGPLARATPSFLYGVEFSCSSKDAIRFRNGKLTYAAPNRSPEVFLLSVRYGVTRAGGSNPVVKKGSITLQYRSFRHS